MVRWFIKYWQALIISLLSLYYLELLRVVICQGLIEKMWPGTPAGVFIFEACFIVITFSLIQFLVWRKFRG